MRSRVLQACRPLRASSPSTQCLRTASSRTPTSRPASSFSKQYAIPRATTYSRTTPQKPKAPSSASNGAIDPQAAIPPATTVTDVDPTLANQIPTPDNTTPSPAFASALAGGPTISNSTENGEAQAAIDWSSSFHGLSTTPFSAETANVLMKELDPYDIEIKPDGIIYLPEIKYRRILNRAFGPGGWGLAPRGELVVGEKVVTREYALVVHGRFIAQARGECQYFSEETIPTAGEGCKSNALLRCCKDLGIASELWDPRFIRDFKKAHCQEIWVEHVVSKKRRQIWTRKDSEPGYPYQLAKAGGRA